MLKTKVIDSAKLKINLLDNFDPMSSTWICSDLKTKSYIQQKIFKTHFLIEEDAILRVSEFWSKLLLKFSNEYRVVSYPVFESIIRDWIQQQQSKFSFSQFNVSECLSYLNQLLPMILENETNDEFISDWFKENPSAFIRWGHWYQFIIELWSYIKQQKIIVESFIPALILSENIDFTIKREKIIFDLMASISPLEAELILKISKKNEIIVLIPNEKYLNTYYHCLWPYQILTDDEKKFKHKDPDTVIINSQNKAITSEINFLRFNTQLAEIQQACNQIISWFNKGVAASEIVIGIPKVESYWPILKNYLDKNKISYNKKIQINLSTYKPIIIWLNYLYYYSDNFSYSQLEIIKYSNDTVVNNFNEFQKLKRQLPKSQLIKNESLENFFYKEKNINFHDFFNFIMKTMPQEILKNKILYPKVFSLLSTMHVQIGDKKKILFENWLKLFESLIQKTEIEVQEENSSSISILNYNELNLIPFNYYILLASNSDEKNQNFKTSLNQKDVLNLSQSLSVNLNFELSNFDDFYLDYILNEKKYISISVFQSNFNIKGEELLPSHFWINNAKKYNFDIEQITYPRKNLWQLEAKKLKFVKELPWSETKNKLTEKKLHLAKSIGVEPTWETVKFNNLSVSRIQRYVKCPFLFVTEKLFKLNSDLDADLDLNHLLLGTIIHKIYELVKSNQELLTDEKIQNLVENVINSNSEYFLHTSYKKWVINYFYNKAKVFLDFERQWQEHYPKAKFYKAEVKVEGYWNRKKKCFIAKDEQSSQNQNLVPIIGFIDRVDKTDEGYILIDYKLSAASVSSHYQWLEKAHFQMPIYALCLESGLVKEIDVDKEVIATVFYVDKDLKRDKGMLRNDLQQAYFEFNNRSKSFVNRNEQLKVYDQTINEWHKNVENIFAGNLLPNPKDKKDCLTCQWRQICRFQS